MATTATDKAQNPAQVEEKKGQQQHEAKGERKPQRGRLDDKRTVGASRHHRQALLPPIPVCAAVRAGAHELLSV